MPNLNFARAEVIRTLSESVCSKNLLFNIVKQVCGPREKNG